MEEVKRLCKIDEHPVVVYDSDVDVDNCNEGEWVVTE